MTDQKTEQEQAPSCVDRCQPWWTPAHQEEWLWRHVCEAFRGGASARTCNRCGNSRYAHDERAALIIAVMERYVAKGQP